MSLLIVALFLLNLLCSLTALLVGDLEFFVLCGIISCGIGYMIFKNTMNLVQYVGSFYWITRDTGKPKDPIFGMGFMRQVSPPWLIGKGPQVRVGKYVIQVGVCQSVEPFEAEEDGLLYALKGRNLDDTPEQIGEMWSGTKPVQKEERITRPHPSTRTAFTAK